jgi:arylsulfatase A-like enzyme
MSSIGWSLFDYAFIGCGAGVFLTLLESLDLGTAVAPFFTTTRERLHFLVYLFPTVMSMTLTGALVGAAVTTWRAFRRWEDRITTTNQAGRPVRWAFAGIKIVLFGVSVTAVAFVLRPTFNAVGRRVSALVKDQMQRSFPNQFDLAKSIFQWIHGHPFIVLGMIFVLIGLIVRWILRRPAAQTFSLSATQRFVLALILGALTVGVYAVDSRYFFSIYDRSIHLPLFFLQLGLSFLAVALIYRTFGETEHHHRRRWMGIGILLVLGATAWTFTQFNSDQSLRALFWSRSVLARRTIAFLQSATDVDRDGFSSMLAGGDGDSTNRAINPLAREVPDNGIDENGLGGDLELVNRESWIVDRESAREPRTTNHESRTRPATILLITIDALRADHLGCYGYERPTSPHLDQFARQGQLFINAHAQGTNTGHSFASMFRSAYGEDVFDENRPSFVELLVSHRYKTVSFSAKRIEKWLRGKTWARYKPTLLRGIQAHAHEDELGQWSADEITDALIDYFKSPDHDGPHFIWAHYLEPHYPYRRYAEFDFGPNRLDRYDSEIAYTDRALGRLFDYFDQSHRWQHTLVIISSDHGEAFFEHGQQEHSSRPYQEQIRIPLLMRHPTAPPARFEHPVGLIDVGPTVLRFAGVAVPSAYEGIDLDSPSINDHRIIISETPRNIPEPNFYVWAMIQGSWKLMYDIVGNTFELYNLSIDPRERRNLIDSDPMKAQEMMNTFGRWFDKQSLRPIHSGDWNLKRILKKPG